MATNYSDLIRTVIRDFDEIYSVLRAKGSQHDGSSLPTSGDTGIATADYANIINSNLVKVNGLSVSQLVTVNSMLDNNTGTTTTGTVSVDYTNEGISITGIKPGYYNASSILSLGATFVDLGIDSFDLSDDGKNYVLKPSANIIKSVTIAKGEVKGSATAAASSVSGKVPTATVDTELTSTVISTESSTGAYPVTLKVTPRLSGEIVATVSKDSVTPGYISSADDVTLTGGDYDISGISVAEATETYYVAKGSVTLNTNNTNITPTLTLGGLVEGTEDNGYAVTTTVGNVTLTATTVAGYVTEDEVTLNAETLTNAPVTKYIAKGSVSGAAANVTKPTITLSSSIAAADSYSGDVYTVTANTAAITLKHTVEEGYVKNSDVSDLTLTADEKSIRIAKGSARASISGNSISASSDYLVSTGGREFTVTSTPVISKELTEGYITNADFTTVNNTTSTQIFQIKEGIIGTPSNTLSVTAAGFTDTDNAIRSEIFKTEQPTSGEYYTVGASSSVSITGGWIDSQTITQASNNKYYVPKATFNFVPESGNAGSFIQVTTGGYIPSGAIVELGNELTEADYATVSLQLSSNEGSIVNNNLNENYYTLKISKASIDAGYISDNNGTVTPYTLKVAKGSVSNTNTVDSVVINGTITGDANGYTIPLNVTAGSTVVVEDGYVKNSEIMVDGESQANNTKKTITVAKSVSIDAATIAIDASAVSGNVSSDGFEFASEVTKYAVTPTIGGASGSELVARATKAGYVDSRYSTKLNVTLDTSNAQTKYLTPGTQLTSVNGSGTVAITNNFGTTQSGNYTISLTNPNTQISVAGTLTEGYYASSEELAVSGRATITGLTGSVSVKHGSVTVNTASAELSVSSTTGLTLHNNATGLDGYYELTLEAESLSLDANTVEGYVKATDVKNNATSVANTSSTKYFISKYVNSNLYSDTGNYAAAVDGFGVPTNANVESWVQNGEVVVQESDSMVIETAGKYVEKNIEVRLAPDATGSNVRNELYTLQQRLLGNGFTNIAVA